MFSRRRLVAAGIGIVLAAVVLGAVAWTLKRFPFGTRPPVTVVRAQLELRDGVLYRAGDREPFDGLLVEDWKPGVRKLEIELARGRAHGRSRGWFENGKLEVEETFKRGMADGTRVRWYASGGKRSEANIRAGVIGGVFREWHGNGVLATEMPMLDGQAHGETKTWFSSGRLKSTARMDRGQVVSLEQFQE